MKRVMPPTKAVILVMTVEIGDGRRDTIQVSEDDQPDMLATAFCMKHKLPRDFIEVLARQIDANIDKVLDEEDQLPEEDWMFAGRQHSPGILNERNRMSPDAPSEVSSSETLSAQFHASASENSRVSQSSRCSVNSSAGDRLYYHGVMKKEQSKQWRDKQAQMKDEQTSKDLTFKPQINTRSKSLAKNHRKAEHSYIEQQRKKLESIERRKGQSLAEQQTECTFTPKVNPLSQAIVRSKSTHRNAFSNLYTEAQERQLRLQEAKDNVTRSQCTFKPAINPSSKSVSRDQSIVERLANSRLTIETNLQKIREKQSSLVDPQTGQEFFKPKVGRPPKLERNTDNLPIGLYLFSHNTSKDSSKSLEPSPSIELLSRQRSTQIIERLKIERFRELFEMLNPDDNEEIISNRVEPEKLSAELLTVLFPLLEELEQLGEPINFSEFCEAMSNLLQTLTPGDKSMILVPRRTVPTEEHSHQPQTNEYNLTDYHQKQLAKLPMYERMAYLQKEKQKRIELAKAQKQQAELEQCTFHPKIKTYRFAEESLEEPYEDSFVVRSYLR